MKRIFLLTALFCSLLTVGAQTDNVRRSKSQTPAKAQTAPARKPAPASPGKPAATAGAKHNNSSQVHDYVDLGLPSGTLWATCNVGASKPEQHGDYFAWGETKAKRYYDWSVYFDATDEGSTFKKYENEGGKTELALSDDAAHANWGGNWCMPSWEQQAELRDKCLWTWTTKNGVEGFVVESKYNGNSIFLPAAGFKNGGQIESADSKYGYYGYYWSRSINPYTSSDALYLGFGSNGVNIYNYYRCAGCLIRPVRAK